MVRVGRAVILTALRLEYQAVRNHLDDLQEVTHPQGTIYEGGRFVADNRIWEVLLAEVGSGNDSAAQECERAINYFNPVDVALFVGVAGGLKDVSIGDVVAATKVYDYASGKAESSFKPRPQIGQPSYRLEQAARAVGRSGRWLSRLGAQLPDPAPEAYVGAVAAGEQVISSTSSESYKLIRDSYGDALAVEMEGYGFLRATYANDRVNALVIRGISDLIEGKAEADKAGSQPRAVRHAAAFAIEILSQLKYDGSGPDTIAADRALGHEVRPPFGASLRIDSATPDFTGRTEELKWLVTRLQSSAGNSTPTLCGISGMAGVGKSTLAIQAAHLVHDAYPDGLHSIDLQANRDCPLDQAMVLDMLIRTLDGLTPERPEERTGRYQELLKGKRVLIVFDNARSAADVRSLLPEAAACAAIVTSRRRIGSIPGLTFTTLKPMSSGEAHALLGAIVGEARISAEPEAASRIIAACGNLPLAIRIAAGLLNIREHWTLARLAEDLAEEQQRLKRLHLDHLSVRTSLEVSYRELDEQDRHIFEYLGLFTGPDFHVEAVAALIGVQAGDARDALERLVDAQLLSPVVSELADRQPFSEDRFRFHDLVRIFAQSHFEQRPQTEQEAAWKKVSEGWYLPHAKNMSAQMDARIRLDAVHQWAQEHGRTNENASQVFTLSALAWFDREWAQLLRTIVQMHQIGDWEALAFLAQAVGSYVHARALSMAGERIFSLALDGARRSADQVAECWALGKLGSLARERGQLAQAEVMLQQALDVASASGDTHAKGSALLDLGLLASAQRNFDTALSLLEQSLTCFQATENILGMASVQNAIGLTHIYRCNWRAALTALRPAMLSYLEVYELSGYAAVLSNLALAFTHLGKPEEARKFLDTAIPIFRGLGDETAIATCFNLLAGVHVWKGDAIEALKCLEQGLQHRRNAGDTYGMGNTVSQMAWIYLRQGRDEDALKTYQHALELLPPETSEWREVDAEIRAIQEEKTGALALSGKTLLIDDLLAGDVDAELQQTLSRATAFRVDNVARFLQEVADRDQVPLSEAVPNVAPLGPVVWMEWSSGLAMQDGDRAGWLLSVVHDAEEPSLQMDRPPAALHIRWGVLARLFGVVAGQPTVKSGPQIMIWVKKDGTPHQLRFGNEDGTPELEHARQINVTLLMVPLTATYFAHRPDRNIIDHEPENQLQAWRKRRGRPPLRAWRTIDVPLNLTS